jgi:hypothetical protein
MVGRLVQTVLPFCWNCWYYLQLHYQSFLARSNQDASRDLQVIVWIELLSGISNQYVQVYAINLKKGRRPCTVPRTFRLNDWRATSPYLLSTLRKVEDILSDKSSEGRATCATLVKVRVHLRHRMQVFNQFTDISPRGSQIALTRHSSVRTCAPRNTGLTHNPVHYKTAQGWGSTGILQRVSDKFNAHNAPLRDYLCALRKV